MLDLIFFVLIVSTMGGIPFAVIWFLVDREAKRIAALPPCRIILYGGGYSVEKRTYGGRYWPVGWKANLPAAQALAEKHARDGEIVQ